MGIELRNLNFVKMGSLIFIYEETEAQRGKVISKVTLSASMDLGPNSQSDSRGSNQRLPGRGGI